MIEKDGGPAFPVSTEVADPASGASYGHQDSRTTWQFPGMTIRDWFAGKALAAMLGSDTILDTFNDVVKATGISRSEWMADQAYKFADAMLAERAK